jgi:hypothetical protein
VEFRSILGLLNFRDFHSNWSIQRESMQDHVLLLLITGLRRNMDAQRYGKFQPEQIKLRHPAVGTTARHKAQMFTPKVGNLQDCGIFQWQ